LPERAASAGPRRAPATCLIQSSIRPSLATVGQGAHSV